MLRIYTFFGFFLLTCFFVTEVHAQNFSSLSDYRSGQNPGYWNNKLPHAAYWQQDVHYTIKAQLDEDSDILSASMQLHYRNNSPDTLYALHFHLYQNAFTPDSYMDKMNARRNYKRPFGHYEEQGLGTTVENIQVDGVAHQVRVDNTLMEVKLERPLPPQSELLLELDFKTYFERDGAWRRMKCWTHYGFVHYNGAHWYPRIAVYDSKFGWNLDQHLGHEFYGEFGIYDVELDMPNNQIVGATGVLQNKDEMMPEALLQKIAIRNFAVPPADGRITIPVPYEKGKRKVWKFHAENVHDFAFVADPTFRFASEKVELENGQIVDCQAFVSEANAYGWQDATAITAETIKVFSEGIGPYAYPKMIVADARAGMEYPMLTMDGGMSPYYTHLLVHEIGHNWFFGAVGSNETYRAMLDEGFTQYLTVYGLEALAKTRDVGKTPVSTYEKHYKNPQTIRYNVIYERYLRNAIKEGGQMLNTHSDYFDADHPYGNEHRQVYYKTGAMLYNLQYVLGDSLFDAAMRNYYKQWTFAHPYDEDLRASFIHFTGVDLNWFFDQWIDTKKNIDYRIVNVKQDQGSVKIVMERKGGMQMPLDIVIKTVDGKEHTYYIPNRNFVKKTSATVLPVWTGWDELNSRYEAVLDLEEQIYSVEIDPTHRLADVYMVDNTWPRSIDFVLDRGLEQPDVWERYRIYNRPDAWFNGYDGFKAGLHMHGGYMNYHHVFDFNFWFNTGLFQYANEEMAQKQMFNQAAYRFRYRTATDGLIPYSSLHFGAKYMDGLQDYSLAFVLENKARDRQFYLRLRTFFRQDTSGMNYLLYPEEWNLVEDGHEPLLYNPRIEIGYQKVLRNHAFDVSLVSSAFGSAHSFTTLRGEAKTHFELGRLEWKWRFYEQMTLGSDIPLESQVYLSGASPEEMMDNKYMRSFGFFPQQEFGSSAGHVHYGGGLNLRAYSGYLSPYEKGGTQYWLYRSHSGLSLNTELEFDQYIPLRIRPLAKYMKMDAYLFGDVGLIAYNDLEKMPELNFGDVRADAGIGTALTIHTWGPLSQAKPLTIRFDVPLYVSNVPYADGDDYVFRWVLGVGRAF